jgi:hypothetical protein
VRKKIATISIVLVAAAVALSYAPPAYAWSGTGIACSEASPSLCMDTGQGQGAGAQVQAFPYTGNFSQALVFTTVTTECDNGYVSEGGPNEGPPCPFPVGSKLNEAFDKGRIVKLSNPNFPTLFYAADASGFVSLRSSGDGELWVQYGGINADTYGELANVYISTRTLSEEIMCETGTSQQLRTMNAGDNNCHWKERS